MATSSSIRDDDKSPGTCQTDEDLKVLKHVGNLVDDQEIPLLLAKAQLLERSGDYETAISLFIEIEDRMIKIIAGVKHDVVKDSLQARLLQYQDHRIDLESSHGPSKLFVGMHNKQIKEDELRDIFKPFGTIVDLVIVKDHNKKSAGYGFVSFRKHTEALMAISALHGSHKSGSSSSWVVKFADRTKNECQRTKGSCQNVMHQDPLASSRTMTSAGTLVLLNAESNIYCEVEKVLMGTWKPQFVGIGADAAGLDHRSISIMQIWRLQNELLLYRYLNKKKEICQYAGEATANGKPFDSINKLDREVSTQTLNLPELKASLTPEVNEYLLLHGTKAQMRHVITNQGLDSRLASSSYFGHGVYLSESSTKSDQYADSKRSRTPNGTPLYMLLVRVVMGKVFVATKPKSYKRAPCTGVDCYSDTCMVHTTLHNSVLGLNRPDGSPLLFREFVVYHPDQCYPEYIIEYFRQ